MKKYFESLPSNEIIISDTLEMVLVDTYKFELTKLQKLEAIKSCDLLKDYDTELLKQELIADFKNDTQEVLHKYKICFTDLFREMTLEELKKMNGQINELLSLNPDMLWIEAHNQIKE